MSELYMITPLEKKSIKLIAELFRNTEDGIQSFEIHDSYRWGRGFLPTDEAPARGQDTVLCDLELGPGAELDDRVSLWVDTNDGTEGMEDELRQAYEAGDMAWIYENDQGWEIESLVLEIVGPYRMDLVDEDGNILQENVIP